MALPRFNKRASGTEYRAQEIQLVWISLLLASRPFKNTKCSLIVTFAFIFPKQKNVVGLVWSLFHFGLVF